MFLKQSVISGGLIGLGVVINVLLENKIIGAMLFSFALLTIIRLCLPLYTGRIGFYIYGNETPGRLLIIFIGNLIGIIVMVGLIASSNDILFLSIVESSAIKFSNNYYQIFIKGFMCGILMFVAVYSKYEIITIFCIMIFILSGYEHCIADFPYLCLNFSMENLLKFIEIVIGNSCGSIFIAWLISNKNATNE